MHIAGLIPLYGRRKVGGELGVLGHRNPVGGERSKYMPHQGKQEIARRENQNHALFAKYSRMENNANG